MPEKPYKMSDKLGGLIEKHLEFVSGLPEEQKQAFVQSLTTVMVELAVEVEAHLRSKLMEELRTGWSKTLETMLNTKKP